MAAGIGSRFGTGIKQLEPVGLNGEIFMDYSIHDAIEAGFDKIVVIIRKDIEDDFKARVGNRIEIVCKRHGVEFAYTYQSLDNIPGELPDGRKKPWGTGHAVLSAKDYIGSPFAVINADDYYGKESFRLLHDFLTKNHDPAMYCMIGFVLKNTLSDHGSVTRGICKVNENSCLVDIAETRNIIKTVDGAESNGMEIPSDTIVSMNMWGLMPQFLEHLDTGFADFFCTAVPANPFKAEYLLPIRIGELLMEKQVSVKMLETDSRWFGITYKEDAPFVVESFRELIESGVYKAELYSDL